jgi:hypothetical protein
MKTKLVFEIDDLVATDLYSADPENEDNIIFSGKDGDKAAVAKQLKLSPDAVDAINGVLDDLVSDIIEKLHRDLEDLYYAIQEEE